MEKEIGNQQEEALLKTRKPAEDRAGQGLGKRTYSLGICSLFVLLAVFSLLCCAREEDGEPPPARMVPVETVMVDAASMVDRVQGIGTLLALYTVQVRPEIRGFIREIGFEGSETVQEGAVLYRLNSEKLEHELSANEAALRAAQARSRFAQQTLNRRKELSERNLIASEQLEEVRSELEQASAEEEQLEARIRQVREQIEDTVLQAPFEGVVSESLVDVGDFVDVGEHLTTLYFLTTLEMEFSLSERYVGRIHPGLPVQVEVTAYPDRLFHGEVNFVSPAVEATTRDFKVKARIDNREGLLKPGIFGQATVEIETRENRPVIPEEALVALREGYMVFVVQDGVAHRRAVQLGLREPGRVEITSGLEIGEEVVRIGHMQLSEGDSVHIVGTRADRISGRTE
jgi:membrane fusion protein, multidrug efflux system